MARLELGGSLVLIGAGKMGGAMLEGWLKLGLDPRSVVIIDPNTQGETATQAAALGARINPALPLEAPPAVILLAVKPQMLAAAADTLKALAGPQTLVISVLAGKTLASLEALLPTGAAVVRAMPNTPAAVSRGITVAIGNAAVGSAQRAITASLLSAVSVVEWIEDEAFMDAVTAVSGSGPAYVFLLAESLARAGAKAGLPEELAVKLARVTVTGAGELLHQSPLAAATLRENVTSPAGTTAAALSVLMAPDGLDPLMEKAVAAAAHRSRELAG